MGVYCFLLPQLYSWPFLRIGLDIDFDFGGPTEFIVLFVNSITGKETSPYPSPSRP